MAPFVLVPGGMCRGWLWQRLVPLPRAAGHEVFTPTLTGLGERQQIGYPDVLIQLGRLGTGPDGRTLPCHRLLSFVSRWPIGDLRGLAQGCQRLLHRQ